MNRDQMVMGYEICGCIAKVKLDLKDEERFRTRSHLSIFILKSYGSCHYCRVGKVNLCLEGWLEAFTITLDGGFQLYLLVKNVRNLIAIPDKVSHYLAASAADAILTAFHVIVKVKDRLGFLV